MNLKTTKIEICTVLNIPDRELRKAAFEVLKAELVKTRTGRSKSGQEMIKAATPAVIEEETEIRIVI